MPARVLHFLTWGIVGIWILLVSIHLYRHYIYGINISPLKTISRDSFKVNEQWFGLYLEGEKIGHMHRTTEKIGDEFRFVQSVVMAFERDGKIETSRHELRCLSDKTFRVKSFDFESAAEGSGFKSHGELQGDQIMMFMEKGGEHRAVNREMKEHPYFPLTVTAALLEQGLKKGMKVRLPVLDFLNLEVVHGTAEVEELIPIKAGVHVFSAYRIKFDYPGSQTRFWIRDNGFAIREKLPNGVVVLYEPEIIAKTTFVGKDRFFDYLLVPTVSSNQVIAEPSKVKRLRVRLSGVDPGQFPYLDGDYQSLNGDIIEVRRYGEKDLKEDDYEMPYAEDLLKKYLMPTAYVQSDEPRIRGFSKGVLGSVTDAVMAAGVITGRMYGWIEKMPTTRIPTALEAYEFRFGECLENTVLYAATARAAGLPVRMAAGLIPVRGLFYYHTWPEVWIGRWVPVDPTRGEWPASAARIRFVAGDMKDLVSFIEQIDQIKIEVLEVL